jgi:hypothetical protein
MNLLEAVNNLTDKGIKVQIAFEEASIQKLLLWGVLAAVIAGVITAFVKKAIH